MLIYILILLLIAFFSFRLDLKGHVDTPLYEKCWRMSFLVLVLLAGLRNEIGIDTYTYSMKYENMPDLVGMFEPSNFEEYSTQFLWSFLLSLFKTLNADWVVVQFVIALVFNLLLFRYIKKTTSKRFLTLFCVIILSWWNLSFEVLRESICIVLLLNGLLELEKKNSKKFFLWCLPAFFIHWFSFVPILIIYLACKCSYSVLLFSSLVLGVLLFIIGKTYVTEQLLLLSAFFSSDMSTRITDYTDITRDASLIGILFEFVTLSLAPVIISFIFNKKHVYPILSKVLLLFFPFVSLRFSVPIFYRLLNYIEIPYAIAAIILLTNKQLRFELMKIAVVFLLIFNIVKTANDFYKPSPIETRGYDYDCRYIPYTSVFEPNDPIRDGLYKGTY